MLIHIKNYLKLINLIVFIDFFYISLKNKQYNQMSI